LHAHLAAAAYVQIDVLRRGVMHRFAVLLAAALVVSSCTPDEEVTGTIHGRCATNLYSPFNPKSLEQCMAVCIKCDHGNKVTCSTSCTLKGAR
jgi:hypothetical protein